MTCLVVVAHPQPDSLCHHLADHTITQLRAAGHEVHVEDLYSQGFDAALSREERNSYYTDFDTVRVAPQVARLQAAQTLVLIFPTWWFGFPAILKGWFDRVWAPGIAFDHASDLGPIAPRLVGLEQVLVVTTLGSPRWIDRLVLGQPVKRVLKRAILGACAPQAKLHFLALHEAETASPRKVQALQDRISTCLARWR